jgi:LysM repeat protein
MNVLRIFGLVVAVHALAFLLIMANPGCSTKSKSPASVAAAPATTASDSSASPFVSAPPAAGEAGGVSFDPNAVAGASRFSPTRPNTPAATAVTTEPVADVTPASTITVGKGDSLWSIAKKHGIPVVDLAAANNLKTGATLQVGQKLVVPSKAAASAPKASGTSTGHASTSAKSSSRSAEAAPAAEPAAAPAKSGSYTRHVVKAGETLGIIARKYGVKQGDIAVANNITNPATLRVGREIIIPSASKSTKAAASAKGSDSNATTEPKPASNNPASGSVQETAQPAQVPSMPVIGGSSVQDSGGLQPAPASNVPVIKLEEESTSPGK